MRMGARDPLYDVGAYNALVDRIRKKGRGDAIGTRTEYDVLRLIDLEKKIDAGEAARTAAKPLNEAAGRLRQTWRRSVAALAIIREKQGMIARDSRIHALNGISPSLLEPVEPPAEPGSFSTVDECDAANAEASVIATEMETKAQKLVSYVNSWERSTPEERSFSIILALADRLERLEARGK